MEWLIGGGVAIVSYAAGKMLGIWPWQVRFRSPFSKGK